MGCGMTAQIMRPQPDPYLITGLTHYRSGGLIANLENPLVRIISTLFNIFFKPFRHLLENESEFLFLSTFGVPDGQLAGADFKPP